MAPADIKTLIAFIVAILPPLIWFGFWLKEDERHPEPKFPLIVTFVAGGVTAFLLLPLESIVINLGIPSVTMLILILAGIEEFAKVGIVALLNFKSDYVDEPIDYAIYLISGAMGFALAENILILIEALTKYDLSFILFTTNMRFLGATILHGLAAAILGLSIGYAKWLKNKLMKAPIVILGLAIVILLHALFNYFIINESNTILILSLGALWIIGIIVLFFFERTRRLKN